MSTKEIDTTKGSKLSTKTPLGSLLSFDEFDNFFDDFLDKSLNDGIYFTNWERSQNLLNF